MDELHRSDRAALWSDGWRAASRSEFFDVSRSADWIEGYMTWESEHATIHPGLNVPTTPQKAWLMVAAMPPAKSTSIRLTTIFPFLEKT